jgi:excinuclease ABC subunit A
VLYARAGLPHCPECHVPLQSLTPEAIVQQALDQYAGKSISVLAPLIRDRKGQHHEVLEGLKRRGLIRARVDGEIVRIEEAPELERYVRHTIEAVVDRLRPDREQPSRLREAVESALELSGGDVIFAPAEEAGEERAWSTSRTCPGCGADTPPNADTAFRRSSRACSRSTRHTAPAPAARASACASK